MIVEIRPNIVSPEWSIIVGNRAHPLAGKLWVRLLSINQVFILASVA